MTSVKRISPAHTTPAAQVTLSEPSSSTLPRRVPGSTGHQPTWNAGDNDGPVVPKIPGPRQPSGLGPRPAPPARPLTARPLSRDIDWNGHIPSAGPAPVPGYDDAYGRPAAWAAFADGAA